MRSDRPVELGHCLQLYSAELQHQSQEAGSGSAAGEANAH